MLLLLLQRDNKIDLLAIWLERLSAKSITAGQEGLPSALTKKCGSLPLVAGNHVLKFCV